MKIGIVGSMQMTEQMLDAAEKLKQRGHDAFVVSVFAEKYVGKHRRPYQSTSLAQT